MTTIDYTPVRSLVPFFTSRAMQSFAVGPVGSTKTTASIMKIPFFAAQVAAGRDGVRRSRYAVVRNTRQMLFDATIKDFLAWLPDGAAGTFHKTDATFKLVFNDVECEILFRGLDDANDVRRLLSLQLTGAMVDECREINPDIYKALTGRVGRYPSGLHVPHNPKWGVDNKGNPIQGCVDDNGRSMKMVWGVTNPPDRDTFWQEYLSHPPEGVHVTIQPGGTAQEADWVHLLPTDYYEDLAVGKDENWINVYIHSKWGESLSGKAVFPQFDERLHVASGELKPNRMGERPVIIGMDFGLNPSAIICQTDPFGRLLVFESLTSDGMGVQRFVQTILKPCLINRFAGIPVMVVGDPAGVQRAQTDERSCIDVLKQEGFRAIPAKTNSLVGRIAAVDTYLTRIVDGKPGLLIDPVHCENLIKALRTGYRYKIKKSGEMDDSPEKNNASHVADAFQYACLHADHGLRGSMMDIRAKPIIVKSARGWT